MQTKFFEKISYLITKPGRFFALTLLEQKVFQASLFLLLVTAVVCLIRVLTDPLVPPNMVATMLWRGLGSAIVAVLLGNCLYALAATVLGKFLGGKGTFIRSYIVGAYAAAPLALLGTTYTALFGVVWAFCLGVVGLKVAHGLPTRRAVVLESVLFALLMLSIGAIIATIMQLSRKHFPAEALVHKPAPAVILKTFNGSEVALSDLKGKVVLLDFWATWCTPCRSSMPLLSDISKEFGGRGLVSYAIADDNMQDARNYLEAFKINLIGVQGSAELDAAFKVQGIPETVVIDKSGVVQAVHVGVASDEKLRLQQEIESCLTAHN